METRIFTRFFFCHTIDKRTKKLYNSIIKYYTMDNFTYGREI